MVCSGLEKEIERLTIKAELVKDCMKFLKKLPDSIQLNWHDLKCYYMLVNLRNSLIDDNTQIYLTFSLSLKEKRIKRYTIQWGQTEEYTNPEEAFLILRQALRC